MKNIINNKGIMSLMLLLLCPFFAVAQESSDNRLFVKDFEGAAGKNINVPLFMTNAQDIVAVQFDIELPYPLNVSGENFNAAISFVKNRLDGHVASVKPLGENRYTVAAMSLENRAFKGNLGQLLNVSMAVGGDAQPGETGNVVLSNIVLCRRDGANVASENGNTALFTVQKVPTPDLTVSGLTLFAEELVPGKAMQLKYVVSNIGDAETGSGWTENIYLVDNDGMRAFVGSKVYENRLNKNDVLNRVVEIVLPEAVAMDGDVQVLVEIVNNSLTGEIIADRGNNSILSSETCNLKKMLFIKSSNDRITEGDKLSFTLVRSGYRNKEEHFTLACDDEGYFSFKSALVIGEGHSGVSFKVLANDNDEVNDYTYSLLKTDAANGYDAAEFKLEIIDNDDYPLAISYGKSVYTEGEDAEILVTVERGGPLEEELRVNLSNSLAARFSLLRAITIPAGEKSASATATIKDNHTPQRHYDVTLTATAPGYTTAKESFTLNDNDRPAIRLELSTDMVSEDAGYGCMTGTVIREGDTDESISIKLDNSSNGEVYFDADRVVIPVGNSRATFPIGVTDNQTVSDTKVYDVWAALYLTDCKQAVGSDTPSYSRTSFTVTDNDTEYRLSLTTSAAAVVEGGEATVTVTRNDEEAEGNLVVTLSANNDAVVIPTSVTIPDGNRSVSFKVSLPANNVVNDGTYFNVKATADGYEPAAVLFAVTDNSLPAYNVKSVKVESEELKQGRKFLLTMGVENCGLSVLEAGMRVSIYIAEHPALRYGFFGEVLTRNELIGYVYTPEAIAAGETKSFEYELELPVNWFGGNYIITMADTDDEVKELPAGKHVSYGVYFRIVSPFSSVQLSADKENYVQGDIITVNGYSPSAIEGDCIEVYLYNDNGEVHSASTRTVVDGTFTAQIVADASMGGEYFVGARAIGEEKFEELDRINICNISINDGRYFCWDVTQGVPVTGTLTVKNMSKNPVSNVRISLDGAPDDCVLTVDNIASIAAGESKILNYSFVAENVTDGGDWVEFNVAVECDEGARNINDVYFYCRTARPSIDFAVDNVSTTLMRGAVRSYDVKFTNTGSVATGDITIEVPSDNSWLGIASPTSLPSIEKGESATITLKFVYREGMIVDGVYESFVRVKAENGCSRELPVSITLVGTELATLTVDAVDIFTMADESGNGQHVAGAKVTLVNKMTGETALTGTTDENGVWTTSLLKEGVYDMYVQAVGHKRYGETIVVGPGENISKEVFLDYQAVTVTYTVEETEIVEEYETRLELVFVPDIPQAVLLGEKVNFGFGGTSVKNLKITNVGKLTAYNPRVELPKVDGVTFTLLSGCPEVVYPNETFEVKVQFDAPLKEMPSACATARVHYGFKLAGKMYTNNDPVLLNWGREEGLPFMLGGGGFGSDEDDGSGFGIPALDEGDYVGEGGSFFEDEPVITPLPTSKHSQVVLEFRQTFFLTRQAFAGTLTIDNAQETRLRDIVFEANVMTMDGENVSDLFAIEYEKPQGAKVESDGTWSIEGLGNCVAKVLYVPSKETAPTEPVKYLFGGKLSYTDVATGKRVSMNLMQTCLTVNPSPDLYLTYLIQREFISDDPLTDDVIEPWEPAEFALLIENRGAGKALDLKIETTEPQIIENVNNLPVKFFSLYSSIDGVEGNFPFTKMDVGAIDAGKSVLARWFFYSNVSGYIADYYAELVKGSIYGSEFNLITVLGAKDLTRSVRYMKRSAPAKAAAVDLAARGSSDIFLLDEIEDDYNLPDHVIDAEGNESAELAIVSGNTAVEGSGYTYNVSLDADEQGWVYGRLHDPTNGTLQLKSVVRASDGADMSGNFWQTDRTMMKDRSVLYEYNLHFADYVEEVSESYLLTFEDKPAEPLKVDAVEGVPAGETNEAVTSVSVVFSKAVDAATFTADDISINCNGTVVPAGMIAVEAESPTRFVIDWSAAEPMYGKYTFALFATGINDTDGAAGTGTATHSWNQILDGNTMLNVEVTPAGSGVATPQSGLHSFGYVTMSATAAEGYRFYRWSEDGKEISYASLMNYMLYKPTAIKAEFVPVDYQVTIVCNENEGSVSGAATGSYEYGTILKLYAVPAGGYLFAGWKVNGVEVEESSPVLSLTVNCDTEVEALFAPVVVDYIMGDVNGDSKVSVTDIVKLSSYIVGNEEPAAFAFLKGDMNMDNMLSITDVVRVVRVIIEDGASAVKAKAVAGAARAGIGGSSFEAAVGNDALLSVSLEGNGEEYVGLQMDIVLPAGMEMTGVRPRAAMDGYRFVYGHAGGNRWRLLAYSMERETFSASDCLFDIVLRPSVNVNPQNCSVGLSGIKLVDMSLEEQLPEPVNVEFCMAATGIDDVVQNISVKGGDALYITAANDDCIAVCTPDGRTLKRVSVTEGVTVVNLERGIYIVCGTKVIIK